MIGSSDHDQVAKKKRKTAELKRRTNPERKSRRKRGAADMVVSSSNPRTKKATRVAARKSASINLMKLPKRQYEALRLITNVNCF